jgi:hypothetical protein
MEFAGRESILKEKMRIQCGTFRIRKPDLEKDLQSGIDKPNIEQ